MNIRVKFSDNSWGQDFEVDRFLGPTPHFTYWSFWPMRTFGGEVLFLHEEDVKGVRAIDVDGGGDLDGSIPQTEMSNL